MTAPLAPAVRQYNWRVRQGADDRLVIPILAANGSPQDVTGYTIDAKIKTQPGGTVLYTWPSADAEIDGDEVSLAIPATVSLAWTWRVGWYRVKLTDPTPGPAELAVSRVLQGAIFLDLD